MKLCIPPTAASVADRLAHAQRVRERLRRFNNRYAAWLAAREGADAARAWHRSWFRPRSAAISQAVVELRPLAHPDRFPGKPSDLSDLSDAAPPWVAERERLQALHDDDAALASIQLGDCFEGEASPDEPPDPTEDFTTYTEVDPNDRYAVTASTITATQVTRGEDAYVYKDAGADHFGAAFEHDLTTEAADIYSYGIWFVWMVSTHVEDAKWLYDNRATADTLGLYWYNTNTQLILAQFTNWVYDIYVGAQNTPYYVTAERLSETAMEVRIYSDAARTTLLDTLAVAVPTGERYRYLYAANTWNNGAATQWVSGAVSDLDLHEAAAGLPIPVAMHHYRQLRGSA